MINDSIRHGLAKGNIEIGAETVFPYADQAIAEAVIRPRTGHGISTNYLPTPSPAYHQAMARLEEKIKAGEMQERDWKWRFDGSTFERYDLGAGKDRVTVDLFLGPTSYQEWKEDCKRSPQESQDLQREGLRLFHDSGFYFSRGTGVVVLPYTPDGKIPVGVRRSTDYDGQIHGVAGWLDFKRDTPADPLADAYRELKEELGISKDQVEKMQLLGIVAYPHTLETDLIYFARLGKTMTQGVIMDKDRFAYAAVDAKEHREWIFVSNPDEIDRLVTAGKPPADSRKFEVLASTEYGLRVLRDCYARL